MSEETTEKPTMNRAESCQLALFLLSNGTANVYYILTVTYIAYYDNGALGPVLMSAITTMTITRFFDAATDPIIGTLIGKTNGEFGKFRPYMVIGNLIMAASAFLLYFGTRLIPDTMMWLYYVMYVIIYATCVIGYIFRAPCTRSRQAMLTNDPNQRPLFTIFNLVTSMLGMGTIWLLAPTFRAKFGDYMTANFFDMMTPTAAIISAIPTLLAVVGIWEKDQPKHYGLGAETQKKVKTSEYLAIMKENEPFRRLMVARVGCRLAPTVATNRTVLCMLYSVTVGNYNALYLPTMIAGYVFSAPFLALTVRTSQKHRQRASLTRYVALALIMYMGVLASLLFRQSGNAAFNLSLTHTNVYTIFLAVFSGVGYGVYYATADVPVPTVADYSDYETYHSGKYIPGVMGTLLSLADKLVSFLSSTVVGLAVTVIDLSTLPGGDTLYVEGVRTIVPIPLCVIPMAAWALTLLAMRRYSLTGEWMKEIQAVSTVRRGAIVGDMSMEETMEK